MSSIAGSPLYIRAKNEGWDLQKAYDEFAFLSYNTKPHQQSTSQIDRF